MALELFTSGTSGRKKLVPIRLHDLCVGAACIAAALELGPEDRGYNMMPLFHVGGIVRNLYAPLLAGSGMIYSDGFDAAMFWDELDSRAGFNWYYASPTMHDSILREGERRPDSAHGCGSSATRRATCCRRRPTDYARGSTPRSCPATA